MKRICQLVGVSGPGIVIVAMLLVAIGGCNTGGFSGVGKKQDKQVVEQPAAKPAEPPKPSGSGSDEQTLGSQASGQPVSSGNNSQGNGTQVPTGNSAQDNSDDGTNADILVPTSTTLPDTTTTADSDVTSNPQADPPADPPTTPPSSQPPASSGSLRFRAVPFVNMEHRSHATEPGSRVLLKDSAGTILAAGPMKIEAACNGDNLESMAYPVVRMNVALIYLDGRLASGQVSGSQNGTLSICIVTNPTASPESWSCKREGRGDDPYRPAFWYDRAVTFTISGANEIEINNKAGFTGNGMGLTSGQVSTQGGQAALYGEPEQIEGGLSFAHPIQAPVCGSSARNYADYNSPLVLDLDRNGRLDLLNVWDDRVNVTFDITGNGKPVRTGWVGPGDGLLALDRDGNGVIDSGRELFGEFSAIADGRTPLEFTNFSDGFQALSQYDRNEDGVVDDRDPVFGRLVVWTDTNADGNSQATELKTMKEAGVVSVSLAYQRTGTRWRYLINQMNEVRLTSTYRSVDGKEYPAADVWFATRGAGNTAALGQ